jgi:hypothetical protein
VAELSNAHIWLEVLDPIATNSNLAAATSQMWQRDLRFGGGGFCYNHFYTSVVPFARHSIV